MIIIEKSKFRGIFLVPGVENGGICHSGHQFICGKRTRILRIARMDGFGVASLKIIQKDPLNPPGSSPTLLKRREFGVLLSGRDWDGLRPEIGQKSKRKSVKNNKQTGTLIQGCHLYKDSSDSCSERKRTRIARIKRMEGIGIASRENMAQGRFSVDVKYPARRVVPKERKTPGRVWSEAKSLLHVPQKIAVPKVRQIPVLSP